MTHPAQARTSSKGRTYRWPPQGEPEFEVSSVTTINKGGVPAPALMFWSAKVVAEFAYDHHRTWTGLPRSAAVDLLKRAPWRQRDAKADIGTVAHAAIEAHVAGKPLPELDKVAEGYALAGLSFLEEFEVDVQHSEATVYSRAHGYAGTLDLIGTAHGGAPYVIDFKTGKKAYPEVGLQLAAYAHADFIGTADGREIPMPPVAGGLVVILRGDGTFEPYPVDIGPVQFETFLHAKAICDWTQTNHQVIGRKLETPAEEAA